MGDGAGGVVMLLLGPLLFLAYHHVQAWATTGWRAQWVARLEDRSRGWARWALHTSGRNKKD
jgi:hypothetical protein